MSQWPMTAIAASGGKVHCGGWDSDATGGTNPVSWNNGTWTLLPPGATDQPDQELWAVEKPGGLPKPGPLFSGAVVITFKRGACMCKDNHRLLPGSSHRVTDGVIGE